MNALAVAALVSAGVLIALRRPLDSLVARLGLRRVYRVGDRVRIGAVDGDVVHIGFLRTRLRDDAGAIVSVANSAALDSPVRNYAGVVRDELRVGIPYRADWEQAERILLEEAGDGSDVDVVLTDNWIELVLRYATPAHDDLSRAILRRFIEAGIPIASRTVEVTVGDPLDVARPVQVP